MNLLNKTRVYLAGNLENTSDPHGWRHLAQSRLEPLGITILTPVVPMFVGQPYESDEFRAKLTGESYRKDPKYVHETMSNIISLDLRMIDLADFVIVNLEVKKPTFGTMHELVVATQQKKPVFLNLQTKDDVPRWLAGLLKPSYIYESLEEVLTTIEKIDKGEITVDSNNWRLLLPEIR